MFLWFVLIFFQGNYLLIIRKIRELKSKWQKIRWNRCKWNNIVNTLGNTNETLGISKYKIGEDTHIFLSYVCV